MAGKKQHFIPQHFQKPFVIPGSHDRLWVFRRGQSSGFTVARKKAAAKEYFYSKPSPDGAPTLDDLVTEYEYDLHKIVDRIRELEIGSAVDSREIAQVIAHLAVRSSHLRETMGEVVGAATDATQRLLRVELGDSLTNLPRNHPPKGIYQPISEELKKAGLLNLTPVTEVTIITLLYALIRERSQELLSGASSQLTEILKQLSTQAPKIIQRAQTSVLQEALAPEERIARLSQLTWHVVPAHGDSVILPDCTSIAFDGREWRPLVFVGSSELKAVALPLAPDRLVVGKSESTQAVDVSQFNRHAAQASYSFFLSNYTSEALEQFAAVLGGTVRTSIKKMMDSAISEAVQGFWNNEPEEDEAAERHYASKRAWGGAVPEGGLNYSVTFEGFGDETFAKSVAERVNSIVAAFSKQLPVSSIDGFTFAEDYSKALNSLERGFATSKEITPTETKERVGVGMPLSIVSDGKIKTRVVLRSSIAADLVSDNEEAVREACGVIFHMLARGALTELMANKFPRQILKPVRDTYEAFLYGYTSGVFEAYFCASLSIWSERQVKGYEEMALSALRDAFVRIPDERRTYSHHGDLNQFFNAAAFQVTDVLTSLARVFGAYKARGQAMAEDSGIMEFLAERDLDRWVNLFREDLEGFDKELEGWTDFTEIFFVHRHFERLIAHFGIVPDRTEGPGAYIHIFS